MTSTEQLEAPQRTRPMLLGRLAGTAVAAVLIAIGVVLATRPVGEQPLRAHATELARGTVLSTQTAWDGSQLLNIAWMASSGPTGNFVRMTSQLRAVYSIPAWQAGEEVDVLYDPLHPADVVFADPGWDNDYRASAALQSTVPFSMAIVALALFVFWPPRLSEAFARESTQSARRSLRRYVVTPAVVGSALLAAAVVVQGHQRAAYWWGIDGSTQVLSVLALLVMIWLFVRAVRFAGLRRQLTVVADAVDQAAEIASFAGRRLWISTNTVGGLDNHRPTAQGVRLLALRGQSRGQFLPGDRVRLYGRSGPAIITDGASKLLAGFGQQAVVRIADPLAGRYPRLGRKLRQYRTSAQTVPVFVCAVSIAVVVIFGLNPAWLWLPVVFDGYWLTANLVRYYTLSPILRGSFVESDGVVHSITGPRRRYSARPAVVIVDVPEQPKVRVRLVGDRRVSWLSEGQEVVIFQGPDKATGPAVLAARDGHAELAIAKPVELIQDSITDTVDSHRRHSETG